MVDEIENGATRRLVAIQKQVTESTKPANDALRWLAETSKLVRLLEGKILVLKSQLWKTEKARFGVAASLDGQLGEVRVLEVRVRMLSDKLELSKPHESTNCDLKATTRKVANAEGNIINLVTKLHRNTISSYNGIGCSVHEALVVACNRLKKVFGCVVRSPQQGVRDVLGGAAESTQSSFMNAPRVVDDK